MKVHLAPKLGLREFLMERGMLDRGREIVQRERRPDALQMLYHAEQGRDTDVAREQQMMFGPGHEREVIARRTDKQHIAFADALVHRLGSPSGIRYPLDGDPVMTIMRRVVAQR